MTKDGFVLEDSCFCSKSDLSFLHPRLVFLLSELQAR